MKKIAIIGHFGGNEKFVDGQTVKTKILHDELFRLTGWEIIKVDTYYKNKDNLKLIFQLCSALLQTKDVIVLLSENGRDFLFPKLSKLSTLFGYRIYHDVIGGKLAECVKKKGEYREYLNSFCVNWVETELLKKELEECGIKNVGLIANFRRHEFVMEKIESKTYDEPFPFCTFSRISKAKGIVDAIEAIEAINRENGRIVCTLDIYGPIDTDFQEEFEQISSSLPNGIKYCGIVSAEKAVAVLKNYYATLFPTRWQGEGSAGTIIESQFAGVPVIATDWHCNKEMIRSGIDGVIYPEKEVPDLKSAILWLIQQKDKINEFRRASLLASKCYLPEKNIAKMVRFIEKCRE